VRGIVEIGQSQVLVASTPGADRLRGEYAVGPVAIDRWTEERRHVARAA